jgi:DNA-binding CsgD family transcriptional regulator
MGEPTAALGAMLAEVLEIMPRAVAVMDDGGAVHYRNPAAADLSDGFFNASVLAALRKAIPGVLQRGEMRCLPRSELGSKAPYAVLMVPLRVRAEGERRCVAVWILHHAFPLAPEPQTLIGLFDLSKAEARLCVSLAQGKSLDECAREGNVSVVTVRSQLHQVFGKTGARRQGELVAMLRRIPVLKTRPKIT